MKAVETEGRMSRATSASTGLPPQKPPLGLRTVALFELLKGVLFAIIALGAASMRHRDAGTAALNLVHTLHLDPAWHLTRLLLAGSSKLTGPRLELLGRLAAALAVVRMVEAYGLWRARAWAEWFAVISAAIYLPVEVYRFWKQPTALDAVIFVVVFTVNVVIVVYLARLLVENRRRKLIARHGRDAGLPNAGRV
jgi:uncharacterized membrane protein (DUF2068 family)